MHRAVPRSGVACELFMAGGNGAIPWRCADPPWSAWVKFGRGSGGGGEQSGACDIWLFGFISRWNYETSVRALEKNGKKGNDIKEIRRRYREWTRRGFFFYFSISFNSFFSVLQSTSRYILIQEGIRRIFNLWLVQNFISFILMADPAFDKLRTKLARKKLVRTRILTKNVNFVSKFFMELFSRTYNFSLPYGSGRKENDNEL